jgi:endogenous inhibitor of DNA gyrase (YacG/DUF329 family)
MLNKTGKVNIVTEGASGIGQTTEQASGTPGAVAFESRKLRLNCPVCGTAMEQRSSRHFVCTRCRQSIHTFEVIEHQYLIRRWTRHKECRLGRRSRKLVGERMFRSAT